MDNISDKNNSILSRLKNYFKNNPLIIIITIFFIILLSFLIIIEILYNIRFKKPQINTNTMRFATILFLVALIIFILSYIALARTVSILQSMTANAHFTVGILFSNTDFKLFVLYILFIPLFGLPLFSRRFALMLALFIFVLFFANLWEYLFPAFVHLQYAPLIVPFLYLDAINSIVRIFEHHENSDTKLFKRFKILVTEPRFKVKVAILVLRDLFTFGYNSYGPLKEYSMTNFDLGENTAVNWDTFNNLEHIVFLIPRSGPYVLAQNNISEIYSKALIPGTYYNSVIDIQDMNFLNNITANDHYFNTSNGLVNTRIDHVLAEMTSLQYLSITPSIYNFTSVLYGSGQYRIIGKASGFVLLKQNYTVLIKYYSPDNHYFSYAELNVNTSTKVWDYELVFNDTNVFLLSTAALNKPLGIYNVTFQISANCTLSNTKVEASAYGVSFIESQKISILPGSWTNITVQFILSNFYTSFQITDYGGHSNGSLMLKSINVQEIKPFLEFGKFSMIIENASIENGVKL
ncbi:MAG: hypothetical protein QXJ93_01735 [Candidatus Rehaiarchaeum fermentans]